MPASGIRTSLNKAQRRKRKATWKLVRNAISEAIGDLKPQDLRQIVSNLMAGPPNQHNVTGIKQTPDQAHKGHKGHGSAAE